MMAPTFADPIREMLIRTHGRGYTTTDLLIQSIRICIGLCFLPDEIIHRLSSGTVRQEDFESAVLQYLNGIDPRAEASFQEYSQTRLLEDTFQELFFYWAQFSSDKNELCRLTDQLVYPHLSRVYRPDLAVPAWLEHLACALLPDRGGTFYDGTAGAGNMAIRIAQNKCEKDLPLQVITREIDPLLFHLSVLRSKMHGFAFHQTNEDCLDTRHVSPQADMSVMFPSLRGGKQIPVSDSIACGGDWSYAYCQLNALNESGVGVCRIPNGALFNAKNQAFREYLLEQNVIDAIITLPKSSVPFWAAAPATSLVVFRKGRKKDDAVWMMEPPMPESPGQMYGNSNRFTKDLLPMLQAGGKQICRSELDPFNLSPQWYLSSANRNSSRQQTPNAGFVQNTEDSRDCNTIRLEKVAQVYRGINVANLIRSAEGVEVLRLSDVQNGRICTDGIVRYDLSKNRDISRYQIRAGDVLISCKGKAIKLCVVSEDVPLFLSHDFLGVRVDSTKVDPWYLYYVLQSPAGQRLLQQIQMGSSIPMIRAADLEHLELHYIPLAMQRQYASELQEANARTEEQITALNASKQRAYEQFYQKIGLEDIL